MRTWPGGCPEFARFSRERGGFWTVEHEGCILCLRACVISPHNAMNSKVLLLVPAALAFLAPARANAYVGFRLNLAVPLYYPAPAYYYPSEGYANAGTYGTPLRAEGEQVTPSPGPSYVWISGHWANSAQRWVWVAGHWELPPSPSAVWVGGHWAQSNGGWVWVNDTWTVGNPSAAESQTPPAPPSGPPGVSAQPAAPQAVPSPSTPPPPAPVMADGVVVDQEPPAPIAEVIPVNPYPDYVWLGGYWGWNGGWFWTSGRWGPRPFHGAAWIAGGWARGARGWAWHRGRWH